MSIWKVIQFWIYYFLPILPAAPIVGRPADADCIFAQAFGRNCFPDDMLGEFLQRGRKANLVELAVLMWLKKMNFQPGKPNLALALKAKQLCDRYNLPVIAQWEIAYALFLLDEQWYLSHQGVIDCIWPPPDGYFSTYHVKKLSIQRMRGRGCQEPIELAHPAMLVRAVMTIWKLGICPVVLGVSPAFFWPDDLWAWDWNSVQRWTKCFLFWLVREIPGRARVIQLKWVAFFPPK